MEKQISLFDELPYENEDRATPQDSNKRFCSDIEVEINALGYTETSDSIPEPHHFKKRAPYKDMYGTDRHSSFLLHHQKLGLLRIEAHRQVQSGSVDQKFPFFLNSLLKAPENTAVLVFDGRGYKKEAFNWLLDSAEQIETKKILIFSQLETFMEYLNE